MKALIISFVLFTTVLYAQSPREIIDRYLDTVSNGDIHNWEKIKSVYSESEVYYSQNNFDGKVDLLRPDKPSFHKSYRVPPFQHKIEIYEDSSFTRRSSEFYYLKSRSILLIGNIPPMIKPAPARDKYFSDYLPVRIWKLAEESKSIELLGIREFPMDGLQCYEIRITTDGRRYVMYVNTETLFFCLPDNAVHFFNNLRFDVDWITRLGTMDHGGHKREYPAYNKGTKRVDVIPLIRK